MDAKLAALLRRALAHGHEPQSLRRAEAPRVGSRVARKANAVVSHQHLYAFGSRGEAHLGLGRSRVLDDVMHRLADDAIERFFPFGRLRDVGVCIQPDLEIAKH